MVCKIAAPAHLVPKVNRENAQLWLKALFALIEENGVFITWNIHVYVKTVLNNTFMVQIVHLLDVLSNRDLYNNDIVILLEEAFANLTNLVSL